ncbi:MAG: DNA replication/repair protein RecF [Chitinophagaceae bacterium]|nr:DNA replication/repair protein RecF [Chitinophagaceae bacterium]
MLRLQQISLLQFKNYPQRHFRFTERVTGICGSNGAGKTNLLDAIHYLCFTRSYFGRLDAGHVLHGASGFRLEGQFNTGEEDEKAVCILRETGRKEFMVNEAAYDKFSRHIGRYPAVVIAPDDATLITGTSEYRRKFLDALLSQLDADYLQALITYTKILLQRNSLLKSFADSGNRNEKLLEVLDEQLAAPGDLIFEKRKAFLTHFLPGVVHLYNDIAGKSEPVNLFYESELLTQNSASLLNSNRQKDLYAQRTVSGIHKDELDLQMGSQPFKQIASQGQRKSLLFAMKLAEMDILRREKGFAPLLLLDDVFEKLDEQRIANLLHKVCVENDGQVFITDTDPVRLSAQLKQLGIDFGMIDV